MANVTSTDKTCPYCETSYEHRIKMPDICLTCGSVLNKEPLGEIFAVPDYLNFQSQEKLEKIAQNSKSITSEEGHEAISKEDFMVKMSDHVAVEFSLFLRTCSFETVAAAVMDACDFLRHAVNNSNLKKEEIKTLSKIAADIGDLGKMLDIHANKGALPYEYRAKNVNSAEIGLGSRSAVDSQETGN